MMMSAKWLVRPRVRAFVVKVMFLLLRWNDWRLCDMDLV